MNNIKNIFLCGTLMILFALLNGCGGGGGDTPTTTPPTSTPVALKFRTYSATTLPVAASPLGAAQLRVLLPQGVTVATTAANPKVVAPGVLSLSGIFTQSPFKSYTASKLLQGSYSSAKPAGSGRDAIRVNMSLNPPNTFTAGEFLTVNCTAATGSATASSNFTLSEVILGGAGGTDLTSQYRLDFKVQ